jgi:hypothetical protein
MTHLAILSLEEVYTLSFPKIKQHVTLVNTFTDFRPVYFLLISSFGATSNFVKHKIVIKNNFCSNFIVYFVILISSVFEKVNILE